jgi:hypothetical protein
VDREVTDYSSKLDLYEQEEPKRRPFAAAFAAVFGTLGALASASVVWWWPPCALGAMVGHALAWVRASGTGRSR